MDRIRRRWDYINGMRRYAVDVMIGMPFGQPQHLAEADAQISRHLTSTAEVRESAGAFALAVSEGLQQGRYDLDDIKRVMGADDDTSTRITFIHEQGHADVRRLVGAALSYIAEPERPVVPGGMREFAEQRADVAHEMLTMLTVTMLRLEARGLLPATPHESPI